MDKAALQRWAELHGSKAKLIAAAFLREPVDVELLLRLARRLDVGLYPIEPFYYGKPSRSGLFLGFGAIDTIDIETALDRVKDVLIQLS